MEGEDERTQGEGHRRQEHRIREIHIRNRGDQRDGVGFDSPLAQQFLADGGGLQPGRLDLQVIYVLDNINDAEALVVDKSVTVPQDLKGKTIAVPPGSTTHFHMMCALEQLNISPRSLRGFGDFHGDPPHRDVAPAGPHHA